MSRQTVLRLTGAVVAGGTLVVFVHLVQGDTRAGLISFSATAIMALVWLLVWWRYDQMG
jgi:hypothetical protein